VKTIELRHDQARKTTTVHIDEEPPVSKAVGGEAEGHKERAQELIANRDYAEAIQLNPNDAEAYCIRGRAYAGQKDYVTAIEDHTQAIRVNPDFAEAYFIRGQVYAMQTDYVEAMEDYNQAIRLNPDYAETYFNRGLVYADQKKYEKAIEDYTQAIELNPKDATFYGFRALAFSAMGDPENEKKDLKKRQQIENMAILKMPFPFF
jgi:tetratricopeptide (TPR) repeat protein